MSARKKICNAYERFGNCKYGEKCYCSHEGPPRAIQKAVATIVQEESQSLQVFAFQITLQDGTSEIKRYFISKGNWFRSDASTGDTVEIWISEKSHSNTGYPYARIARILTSDAASKCQDCFDFLTYRDCKWGAGCQRNHDTETAFNQQFLVAEVRSVTSLDGNNLKVCVEVKGEHASQFEVDEIYIPSKYPTPVKERNVVIVQVSHRKHDDMYFGKIVTILSKTSEFLKSEIPLENGVQLAVTFVEPPDVPDAPSQKKIISGYSIEKCLKHENCQKIGVHIIATALESLFKLDKFFVPFHRANNRSQVKCFDVDSIRLALTMYVHSASSDQVEGPILTPLSIRRECVFTYCEDDAPEYKKYIEDMWPVFGHTAFIESVACSLSATYMVDFPHTWKERILVRQMIRFFNEEITKYLMRLKNETFVLVQNILSGLGIAAGDVVIPAENLELVERAWQLPSSGLDNEDKKEMALGFLLGSARRSAEEFWEELVVDRYTWGVVSCSGLKKDHVVVSTSPIRQTVDFLNQQIVLSLMISPTVSLYSKDDLLGAITQRHSTPMILKAVVRKFTKNALHLQLRGVFGRRRGNRTVRLDKIFKCSVSSENSSNQDGSDGGGSDDTSEDSISLVVNNLNCQNYCNCKLVCLSGKQIAALATVTIDQGVEAVSDIRELLTTRREYDAPYETHERGTLVTLGRGVELELQVKLKQEDDVGDHWLRLLRIGKDCHLCLVHLNSPKIAYLSGRADTTGLITQRSVKQMEEKIAGNSLKTVILNNIAVEWNDDFFSGGSFTAVADIRPRNLLCIRREINGNDNRLIFVWTCHAVVSKFCGNRVEFLVCSLFQDQTSTMWPDTDIGNFIVEVIDVDEENTPNQ